MGSFLCLLRTVRVPRNVVAVHGALRADGLAVEEGLREGHVGDAVEDLGQRGIRVSKISNFWAEAAKLNILQN